MSSLGDLPGLGAKKHQQNDYDFGGFDDFADDDSNQQQNQSKY